VNEYLGGVKNVWIIARWFAWTLIECKVRVIDAGPLQRGDHAVELGDIGHRPDAHPVHSATRDLIVAHEYLTVAAAAQFLSQAFRVGGVGERAGLYEQRGAAGGT
jgi:hypothetical protein